MKKNDEIIAVITAVLNLYKKRPEIKLRIKSIKRNNSSKPVWASTGRLVRMERRLST